MAPAAQLIEVSKAFGPIEALREVSLEVRAGEVLALLGPNGAGKTTALALMLGLRRPDAGVARLFGHDPRRPSARARVGATPQDTGFPDTLRVVEVVELVRAHFASPLATHEVLGRFGLQHVARRQTGGLSGGERRRLAVALAFAGNPQAVFLDEPTTGLDVESRRELWAGIGEYVAAGGTVLLTTHYLEEAEALASRIVVLDRGRISAEGSATEIARSTGLARVRLKVAQLPPVAGIVDSVFENEALTLYTGDAGALVAALVHAEVPLDGLEVLPASLEEAFLALTRSAG